MINIYREPEETSTPYLPVFFDCSSDLGTITNMIADIYVNGSLVSTIDKDPILGFSDRFRFDVAEVLKKHFTNDITTTGIFSKGFRASQGSALNYKIRAFEVLDNGTTFDTSWSEDGLGTNYIESTELYSFDGLMHYTQQLRDYVVDVVGDKLSTNRPFVTSVDKKYKTSKFLDGQEFEIGYLSDVDVQFLYEEYDENFSLISTTTYPTHTPTNNKVIWQHDGVFTSGTKFIRLRALDKGGVPVGLPYIFEVVQPCENTRVVYWKNQYGSYDYYFFEGNYKKSSKSKQRFASKKLDYNYSLSDRGVRVLESDNEERFTIYTKSENYRVIDWLNEIKQSTDVYIYEDSNYIPIIVTGGSSSNIDEESPVMQFNLKFIYANPKESQIG